MKARMTSPCAAPHAPALSARSARWSADPGAGGSRGVRRAFTFSVVTALLLGSLAWSFEIPSVGQISLDTGQRLSPTGFVEPASAQYREPARFGWFAYVARALTPAPGPRHLPKPTVPSTIGLRADLSGVQIGRPTEWRSRARRRAKESLVASPLSIRFAYPPACRMADKRASGNRTCSSTPDCALVRRTATMRSGSKQRR